MKRILTRKEREKKETRNKMIIGLILAALMMLSVIGYALFSSLGQDTEKIEYNGVEFVLNDAGRWEFKIQNFEFLTQYTPEEAENISTPIFTTINNYAGRILFFIGEGPARQEISLNLNNFVLSVQDGCVEGEDCAENTPIKNCSRDNIIILKEADYIEISQEDNCIFIESPFAEQTRTADAFLFKILGVRGF